MKLKLIILALCTMTFFISCEEEISFESKKFVPKIVLNSFFTNDSIWVISLTHTTSIFDSNSDQSYIEDAVISLINDKGEQVCHLYNVGKGIYKSNKCVSVYNESYKINVYSPTYGSVTAKSKIPAKTSIDDIKITVSDDFINASEIEFKINDNSLDKNYYIYSIVAVDTALNSGATFVNSRLDFNSWVKEIKEDLDNVSSGKLTNASTFSPEEAELQSITKIVSNKKLNRGNGSDVPDKPSVVPMLKQMTVSPELYTYYKSLEAYLKYNSSNNSVAEPQKLFSNVDGGLGIFAGYSIQYFPLPK